MSHVFILDLIKEYIGRYGINKATEIIVQSQKQQKCLKDTFNRSGSILPAIFPVPMPPFHKANPPIVLWISHIKPMKQIEIFTSIAENCQDLNAQFICAGRTTKVEYANLLENTSLFEGYPNTYIQAWLRETPVVALNHDPDNLLKEKGIGLHSGSVEQLIKDVRFLIEDRSTRIEMGKKARAHAMECHDIDKVWNKYLSIFKKLADA